MLRSRIHKIWTVALPNGVKKSRVQPNNTATWENVGLRSRGGGGAGGETLMAPLHAEKQSEKGPSSCRKTDKSESEATRGQTPVVARRPFYE